MLTTRHKRSCQPRANVATIPGQCQVTIPRAWTSQHERPADATSCRNSPELQEKKARSADSWLQRDLLERSQTMQRARSRSHPRSQVLFFADASTDVPTPTPSKKACKSVSQKPPVRNAPTPQVNKTCASSEHRDSTHHLQLIARIVAGLGKASSRNFLICVFNALCSHSASMMGNILRRDVCDADATASVDPCSHLALNSMPQKIEQQNGRHQEKHVSINQQERHKLQRVSS